jgi:hypothetical protein
MAFAARRPAQMNADIGRAQAGNGAEPQSFSAQGNCLRSGPTSVNGSDGALARLAANGPMRYT